MESLPPAFQSQTFNNLAFTSNDYLTLLRADSLYLALTGGVVTGPLTVTNNVTISKNTGDLLTITSTDSNSRSTIKFNCPGVDMEVGLRSATTGTAPSHYYRYGNGGYRYIQSMINGDAINYGRLTVNTSGSHLSLVNGGNTGFIEVNASGVLRIVDGLSMNLEGSGLRIDSLGNTAVARSRLDLGASAGDKTFSIFNNGTSYYGLSANSNLLQYSSHVGHQWYTGCTDASPINTALMNLGSNGVLTLTNNLIAAKGWFVTQSSFSSAGRSGPGLVCHMANASFAELFTWDYNTSLWKDLKINNTMYVNGTNSFVQIGANPGNSLYPLAVSGNFTTSFAGSYGYLNNSGAGSGTSTGSAQVTCFLQHRLWCSEVNAFSDRRLKENFSEVSSDDAIDFIKTVKAKNYNWKADKNKKQCTGYVAQDILKFGRFDDLVALGPDEDLEEEIDEDGFLNPAKHRFLVSYQAAVPILHAAIAQLIERIESLEEAANKPKRGRPKKNE